MNEYDMLSSISPEVLEQLLGLGTLDEKGAQLEKQMMMAQALRQPSGAQHTTGLGAALGGLGDVINSGAGAYQTNKLQGQQQDLLGQKDKGRKAYVQALIAALRGQQPQPTPDFVPPTMMGM